MTPHFLKGGLALGTALCALGLSGCDNGTSSDTHRHFIVDVTGER